MPDDWRDVVKKITDDWSDNLEDLMVKHSEAEFLKHAASTGVNFNLIQTEALKKLVLEDVGFVAQTNKKIGQSIIDDIEKLLITKGDWASAKDAVLEHVDNVFSGQEKIVIDNIGKQVKRAVLDAELGHVVLKDFTVKRKWTGNVNAYSDMVAKSLSQKARTMGDLEGYRTTTGIIGWRRMSSLGGKTCELCASLHGRAYYFAGDAVDTLPSDDGLMFEPHPNGFCYQAPIYEEWTGLKNLNEIELDDHLARWKVDTKSPIKNLKRVPSEYGRGIPKDIYIAPIPNVVDKLTLEPVDVTDMTGYKARDDLTFDEEIAVTKYMGYGYQQINRSAAGRTTTSMKYTKEQVEDYIVGIDSAIKKSTVDRDMVLYRGIKTHRAEELIQNGSITQQGFMSTSMSPIEAFEFTKGVGEDFHNILVMEREKGSLGLFINDIEKEILLPRDTGYKLTKVVHVKDIDIEGFERENVRLLFVEWI